MKKLFLLAMATVLLAACQSDDNTPEVGILGKWNLEEAQSGWDGTITPASSFSWSDSYEFKGDGTFVKFNTLLGVELPGTYNEEIFDNENFRGLRQFTLTFDPEALDEVLEEGEKPLYRNMHPDYWIVYSAYDPIEAVFLSDNATLSNPGRGMADNPTFLYRK